VVGSLVVVKSVVVTGAATGIGRATALRLDAAGWRVFAGVRQEADAEALGEAGSERLVPVMLDVTDPGQIAAAAEQIAAASDGAGLDGLVNNAAAMVPSPLETLPIEDFRRQVEINLTGQVAVTQALLPQIRMARGRIVFISSIGGRIAFPLTGAYHAAKFGLEAVGDVFRQELAPWGISVSLVEPGSIDTSIWGRGEREVKAVGGRAHSDQEVLYGKAIAGYLKTIKRLAKRGISPEKVAEVIEHALSASRPRTRYLVGLDAKIQARLKIVVPARLFDRAVARVMGI
jgi:NAD(P)-dependent dehydrogenase (short-subunit alcohol dehydrogenase family)